MTIPKSGGGLHFLVAYLKSISRIQSITLIQFLERYSIIELGSKSRLRLGNKNYFSNNCQISAFAERNICR